MTIDYSNLDGHIWIDGAFTPWADAKVHVLSHTLQYGLGVFEGVRAYKTDKGAAIFRLADHSKRLLESAKIMKILPPVDLDTINRAQIDTLNKNNLDEGYIRPVIYSGACEVGLRTTNLQYHLAVAAWSWPSYLGAELEENGLTTMTSTYARGAVTDGFNRAKVCGGYIANILALKEAIQAGCDEAIMLDSQGMVCEGSGENIFMVKDGNIFTPPTSSCLDGITRDSAIQIAQAFNLTVTERHIGRDELWLADEIFMTGTAAEVVPVREVDRRKIGTGKRGEITKLLQSEYKRAVRGESPDFSHWLFYCK